MTKTEFTIACNEYLIDPFVALENEELAQALRDKDDSEVLRILTEEF